MDIHRGAGMYQTFWRTQIRRPDTPFTWRQYSLKVAVLLATVSPLIPPIFVVIIVFFCARYPIAHITLLLRLLFHRVSTLSPGKPTLSSDFLTLPPSSKSNSCTPKQHVGHWKKWKKYLAKATRSLLGRLERMLVWRWLKNRKICR